MLELAAVWEYGLRRRDIAPYCAIALTKVGLKIIGKTIEDKGGTAHGYLLNAIKATSVEDRIKKTENRIGAIEVVVFNLGAQIGDRLLCDTSYKAFELGWRMATFALFRVASSICPLMEARGKGTILVTSATGDSTLMLRRWRTEECFANH